MEPWFAPRQMLGALGVTLPLFVIYAFRIYSLVSDHRGCLKQYEKEAASPRCRLGGRFGRFFRWFSRSETSGQEETDGRGWIATIFEDKEAMTDPFLAQLAVNKVYLTFDRDIGAKRRSMKADISNVVLLGFIGTLLGMIQSFTSLLWSVGSKGLDPSLAIAALIQGGLSTALISSLIAAVMAVCVTGYLSITESKFVEIKLSLIEECHHRLKSQRTP